MTPCGGHRDRSPSADRSIVGTTHDGCIRPARIFFAVLFYLGSFLIVSMISTIAIRALANERRLQILEWLKNPTKHFPPQIDGDLVKDGVCGCLIARKLHVSQPTTSEHMRILCQAGLTRPKRIKKWTFYRRDEVRIKQIKKAILAKV